MRALNPTRHRHYQGYQGGPPTQHPCYNCDDHVQQQQYYSYCNQQQQQQQQGQQAYPYHPQGYQPMTEFRQPLQVQSHLEMPGILVQLGHIQCT